MLNKKLLSVIGLSSMLLAGPAVAAPLIDFTNDASPFTWFGNSLGCSEGCTLGYSFNVNGPISIDALGIYDDSSDGLTHDHQVGIWDAAGTLLASTTVGPASSIFEPSASGDGRYVYGAVAPLGLSAGRYTIGAFYALDTTDHVVFEATGILSNSPLAAYDSLAWINFGAFTRPTETAITNDRYFGPTARFGAPVPEPAALLLVGAGLVAAGLRRRREA